MGLKQKLLEAGLQLENAKQMLAEAERNYDALYKQATCGSKTKKGAAPAPQIELLPAHVPKSNFTDRIVALLVSDASKEWSYADILKTLPDIPKTTIPALLFRLQKAGKVTKAGRGTWKMAA